ncbi:MAG: tol-pal system protein YbgF [Maricaulaceae bacterium]
MDARLRQAEETLAVVSERVLTGDPAAVALMVRLDALEAEVRELTGTVEQLGFENRRLRDELTALGRDVDDLHTKTETRINPDALFSAPPGTLGSQLDAAETAPSGFIDPRNAVAGGDAQRAYTQAYDALTRLNFDQAETQLTAFVETFDADPLAGDAYFWLGEIAFLDARYADAAQAYLTVLGEHRGSVKAPDSLVKLGAALANTGDAEEACKTLSLLGREFPNAPERVRQQADIEKRRAGC